MANNIQMTITDVQLFLISHDNNNLKYLYSTKSCLERLLYACTCMSVWTIHNLNRYQRIEAEED